jgi:RNA polymerase sigma-70 factor (ECF subfamily)
VSDFRPDSLIALLQEARAGSAEALGRLLEAFRPYLLAIANDELESSLQPKGGASDLVQETCFEAQCSIGDFRGQTERELLGWLRQMLLNNLANFGRQFRQVAKRQVGREIPLDNSSRRELRDGLAAEGPSPPEQTIHNEQLERVAATLDQLPAHYREVIVWRNLERQSFAEIARRLNRTEKTAQKLWCRAIQALQRRLADGK